MRDLVLLKTKSLILFIYLNTNKNNIVLLLYNIKRHGL
jgi:hypothetical protein